MGRLLTLIVAFFISLLVGGMLQNVLGVWANAREEFILAIMLFVVLAFVVMIVFSVVLFARFSIDWAALWLAGIVLAVTIATLVGSSIAQGTLRGLKGDLTIMSYIALPTLLMIVIQWWFVRRRALRDARENVAA